MDKKLNNTLIEAYKKVQERYTAVGVIYPDKRGEFRLSVYAVNHTKSHGYRITEVNRAWSGRDYYVAKDLWRSWCRCCAGIRVCYDERSRYPYESGSWYNGRFSQRVSWAKEDDYWFFKGGIVVNPEALQQTKYRYCAWRGNSALELMKYIRIYKEHPKVELLSKANLTHLIQPSFLKKLEKDRDFARFFRDNFAFAAKSSRQDFVYAYRHGIGVEDARRHLSAVYNFKTLPNGFDRDKVAAYCDKRDVDPYDYIHYATNFIDAEWSLQDEQRLYPKDFHAAAAKASTEALEKTDPAEAKRQKERDARLLKVSKRMDRLLKTVRAQLGWRVGDMDIILPITKEQFRSEGNAMHNCISGYYARQMDTCICFFIYKGGQPFVDVEVGMDGSVRQCRENRNKPAAQDMVDIAEMVGRKIASSARRAVA